LSNRRWLPPTLFALLALAVTGPLFRQEGFVFLLDMVWGPRMGWADLTQDGVSAHLPQWLLLQALARLIPLEILQKLLLTGLLWGAGYAAFRLAMRWLPVAWALFAGVLYMTNPYVFERLMAGHWIVLSGYVWLPVVFGAAVDLLERPSAGRAWRFGLLYGVYPVVSLHWAYIATGVVAALAGVRLAAGLRGSAGAWRAWVRTYGGRIGRWAGRWTLLWSVLNGWWLYGYLQPGSILRRITLGDFAAYGTRGDPVYGPFWNVLSLHGFWSSDWLVPKDYSPAWPWIALLAAGMALAGLIAAPRAMRRTALTLLLLLVPVWWIAVGYAAPWPRETVRFLYEWLPGFAGLRETAKVTGVLALIYALGVPLCGWRLGTLLQARVLPGRWLPGAVWLVSAVSMIGYHAPIFGAAQGQMAVAPYPAGWEQAQTRLEADAAERVWVLPWQAYLRLSFADGRPVANPARAFFGAPLVTGNSLENTQLADDRQRAWDQLLIGVLHRAEPLADYAGFLEAQGISHILLIKSDQYAAYTFLAASPLLERRYEDDTVAVYRIGRSAP
jgi:hypothetical protein